MSDSEVRGTRAFYDHELEDGHATGRRRRPVADWGVGEEIFDHMPSRRRFRSGEGGARREAHAGEAPRRDAHARPERAPQPSGLFDHDARPAAPVRPAVDFDRPTDELHPAGAVQVAERPRGDDSASAVDAAWMAELAATAAGEAPTRPAPDEPAEERHAELDAVARPGEGRRTVVIRGRGAEPAPAQRQRRPPRTVGERLGPRPDRVAAWAVALGVLLILIAILTAH